MRNTRTKHTAAFRAKVALGYGVHVNPIYKWKREFLENAERAFTTGETKAAGNSSEREDELLRKIGELTVERDFLAKGLGRLG
jgi:transposase